MATGGRAHPTATGGTLAPSTKGGPAGGKPSTVPTLAVPLGSVRIWSENPEYSIQAPQGDAVPQVTGRVGGWNQQDRPRRKSLTIYNGVPGFQVVLAVMFDKFKDEGSVEPELRSLERMATVNRGDTEPPTVGFDAGGSIAHDATNDPDIQYATEEEKVIWREDGRRCRQMVTVTLIEKVEDEHIQVTSSAQRKRSGHPKTYVVKKGDTLKKIALRFYKDARKAKVIQKANKIRDPNHLKVGQKIRLP
jgi:nucleoid-associated protein YgaU